MSAAWMVRAGRAGEREGVALAENVVIAGWLELGDISDCSTRDELRALVEASYPRGSRARISNWTGQLWSFLRTMREGDYVVMPLKNNPDHVAIGIVSGPYQYRAESAPGFRHVRPVRWEKRAVPRRGFRGDLLASMGSLLTVCRLSRFDAATRIAQIATTGEDPGDTTGSSEPKTAEVLLDEAVNADIASPVTLTIRDLIGAWGYTSRNAQNIMRIERDLSDKGLTTRPPFTDGVINDSIAIVKVGEEPVADDQDADPGAGAGDITGLGFRRLTLRVADLPSARRVVESVTVDASLTAAMTLMTAKKYSQLAVLDEQGALYGAISWESIGKCRFLDGREVTVRSATLPVTPIDHDADLLSQISRIIEDGFVFVKSTDSAAPCGIITASDLSLRFKQTAEPIILIEEVEMRLRNQVESRIDIDTIRTELKKPKVNSVADLTIGNYKHLFSETIFKTLDWPFDRDTFLDCLENVRVLRNELMHFSPDEPDESALDNLRGFAEMLRLTDRTT